MSSREIAELTGKEHKDVMRDARTMLEQLGMTSAQFCAHLPDSYGRPQPVFNLPKDLTLTLVAGYSVPLRHRIVTRLQELEAQVSRPVAALPNFTDPAEAPAPHCREIARRDNEVDAFRHGLQRYTPTIAETPASSLLLSLFSP